MLKKLPLDLSSFGPLIKGGYMYVDKTEAIHTIINKGRCFFMARPRRFGKSLLISTFKEILKGNDHLFKGLWIHKEGRYHWPKHPVIHLDFSGLDCQTPTSFSASLGVALDMAGKQYAIDVTDKKSTTTKLNALIYELAQQNTVVLLIDEYDAPIIKNIEQLEMAEEMRRYISNFFTTVKSLDEHLRFVFITGVTKFSKASAFSGFNNLNDITIEPIAATLCGYTEEEIRTTLLPYIDAMTETKNTNRDSILNEMRTWYNGYRFSQDAITVYNPFSVGYYLDRQQRENYWFASGTPSFLIKCIENDLTEFEHIETTAITKDAMGTFEIDSIPLPTLLLQTGYLTIKHYDATEHQYHLGYPNKEVQISFAEHLLAHFLKKKRHATSTLQEQIKRALIKQDIEAFCTILQNIFSHLPYQLHVPREAYYHSLLHMIGSLTGFECQSEMATATGRIDLILKTNTTIYLIELKINKTPAEAIAQIREKRYSEGLLNNHKNILLIGLNIDTKTKKLCYITESK